ncbi:helix-turn-helix transcriptional regulator [Nodosilinea sp. LEGE 07088]|uniref:AraC family transcriptional regulator n=1 Tax=Nodosilinea sp. LEGE 07088 TaxID=2777968 RepID=UPI00187E3F37|nr:AraC family transcriptional regulator [Nodosilinea sp. LEGE 07088]MBE9140708.1 helix-turn-helix transcriptional regulator [Nodosilinea sp. LEGE 07088]
MSDTPSLTVDFTQSEEVLQILPRSPLRSSEDSGWNGIYMQQHLQPSWETPDYAHIRHLILVHGMQHQVQAERAFEGRRRQEQIGRGSNVVIVPATVQHQSNWSEESPFSLLFLEPDFLTQVAYESVTAERIRLIPQYAMDDPLIDQIGRSLSAELDSDAWGGRLFADSLMIALSIHLIRHYSDWQQPLREYAGGLPQRKLQKAITYINEHLSEEISITAIADEVEMSQYYFSRLFKQSTGISPYQYVTRLRIERTKYLLKMTSLPISAITLQVGFSNQNQLTIQFRKSTGTTPSNYRKQL